MKVEVDIFFPSTVVVFGFDSETYTFTEDAGDVQVNIQLLEGSLAIERGSIMLLVKSSDGTGTCKKLAFLTCLLLPLFYLFITADVSDYTFGDGDVFFSADGGPVEFVTLSIGNDAAVEGDESFTLTLSSDEPDAIVNASLSVATITILDDDGE